MFFSQDDQSGGATEGISAVGLQTRHPAEAALPVLTTAKPSMSLVVNEYNEKGRLPYLRTQLVVSSKSLGVMMLVSDATEAAQYTLL